MKKDKAVLDFKEVAQHEATLDLLSAPNYDKPIYRRQADGRPYRTHITSLMKKLDISEEEAIKKLDEMARNK